MGPYEPFEKTKMNEWMLSMDTSMFCYAICGYGMTLTAYDVLNHNLILANILNLIDNKSTFNN